jgi:non-specific serine/threonine protein kinase
LTSFVGRENELAAVAALLDRDGVRLVTLTGPGDIGKTRLAVKAALDLVDRYPDGDRFVPLADVDDAGLVGDAVLRALGVDEATGRPLPEALAAVPRNREALLVLDNLEHVLAAAPMVVDLLVACPRLIILVTSRALLRVSGEHAFAVPPLAVPVAKESAPLAELASSPAVRLFADRAKALVPSFALTEATSPLVADFCRRIDGLPLAIEIAAALGDRLDRTLPMLTVGPRDAPPRQRTMHDAIA